MTEIFRRKAVAISSSVSVLLDIHTLLDIITAIRKLFFSTVDLDAHLQMIREKESCECDFNFKSVRFNNSRTGEPLHGGEPSEILVRKVTRDSRREAQQLDENLERENTAIARKDQPIRVLWPNAQRYIRKAERCSCDFRCIDIQRVSKNGSEHRSERRSIGRATSPFNRFY